MFVRGWLPVTNVSKYPESATSGSCVPAAVFLVISASGLRVVPGCQSGDWFCKELRAFFICRWRVSSYLFSNVFVDSYHGGIGFKSCMITLNVLSCNSFEGVIDVDVNSVSNYNTVSKKGIGRSDSCAHRCSV